MVGALAYGLSEVREGWTVTITVVVINIAKGTTDPRVEFILPKSYCKFKHKS